MMNAFIRNFFRKDTVWRAIRVAVIVAPILIIINHHDQLLEMNITPRLVFKCVLTFLVPYCVSAYSSAMAYASDEMSRMDAPE